MDVPARLKWVKEPDRFAAYPVSNLFRDRIVWIAPYTPVYQSWKWAVSWEGWFSHHGFSANKQAAADDATEAWWRLVRTDVPRDVDFDATRIVAQVLVQPIPNNLFGEDGPFLQKVLWHLKNVYRDEIKAEEVPPKANDLIEMLESEIERRLDNGELKRPIEIKPQKMRRRRR
jgi:hypothetical protein